MRLFGGNTREPWHRSPLAVLAVGGLSLLLQAREVRAQTGDYYFDGREATIDGVHNALFTGLATCRGVVSSFLSRIEAFNPAVNAVLSLNPDALARADELDTALAAGNVTGRLFCVPVLLKDNYDAVGMNTTGGCLALAGNRPTRDAPTVRAFRDEGAVILGKVNLHELALEGISVSSLGGQTINPYDRARTPGGSSGGTGAAIAASLAVFGTGTDTVNSLRSPASANSLVSVRPTGGLISRAGVIPISYTQDVAGPIARTVRDLAVALTVMAGVGFDGDDNATALAPPEAVGRDYAAGLTSGSLEGLRFGMLDGFWNHTPSAETTPVNEAMAGMLDFLRGAGVELVNVTDSIYNATAISAALDLYTSGRFLVLPSQYGYVNTAFSSSTSNASYAQARLGIQNLTTALRRTFSDHRLDGLVYPEQKNLVVKIGSASQSGRNGILAALTGSPVVTVPAGFSAATADAPAGVPVGMEILGLPFSEAALLNAAAHITQQFPVRRMPPLGNTSVETREYAEVPVIKPNNSYIPEQYTIGVL
ncbi:hypothetical protein KJ359_000405 [Pestalotiopsis sp. 9143b]|nr:hypothetical protein KJ359_000405 [Pestalotiopsis sp. 9143b]